MNRKQEIILEIVHVLMISGAIASFIIETVYDNSEVASNLAILCSFIGGLYGVSYVPVIRHDYIMKDDEEWLKNQQKEKQNQDNQKNNLQK